MGHMVDTGSMGDAGGTEDTGSMGDAGGTEDTGSMGDAGGTGSMGDAGGTEDTGSMGETGDKGDTGDKENTQDTGDTGDTGGRGDTGRTGDTGEFRLLRVYKGHDFLRNVTSAVSAENAVYNISNFGSKAQCYADVEPGSRYILFLTLYDGRLSGQYDDLFGAATSFSEESEQGILDYLVKIISWITQLAVSLSCCSSRLTENAAVIVSKMPRVSDAVLAYRFRLSKSGLRGRHHRENDL
ncbi:hypothetical protein RRG08_066984 [Elysia crispata]|uniref:Uncharacterized protein n=1 Tax=Elysia crispata TaxID=231223 RepID=A0AAE1DCJ6_9GAST|nr:hypothetical protein RRG08_066984 [Elysia crispata]